MWKADMAAHKKFQFDYMFSHRYSVFDWIYFNVQTLFVSWSIAAVVKNFSLSECMHASWNILCM